MTSLSFQLGRSKLFPLFCRVPFLGLNLGGFLQTSSLRKGIPREEREIVPFEGTNVLIVFIVDFSPFFSSRGYLFKEKKEEEKERDLLSFARHTFETPSKTLGQDRNESKAGLSLSTRCEYEYFPGLERERIAARRGGSYGKQDLIKIAGCSYNVAPFLAPATAIRH